MLHRLLKATVTIGALLAAAHASAAPTILANGVNTLSLQAASGCYQMAVAYNPVNNQYYGGGGGSPSCNGSVWNASGSLIQNLSPINVDIRGVNYNSNNGQIEIVGYGSQTGDGSGSGYSGLYQMGLNGSGLYTGVNSQVLTILPGTSDDQSVSAYDASRDVLYSQTSGSNVNVTRRSDGSLQGTIALSGHSLANVMNYAIGYDPVNDVLIEFDAAANQALVFDMSGAFLGASQLAGFVGQYDSQYSMSYSNGLLFVGNGSSGGYAGFRIFGAPVNVPEPGSLALLALGFAGLGVARRRKAG